MAGEGGNWRDFEHKTSQFRDFVGPITILMRNMKVTQNTVKFGPREKQSIVELQTILNDLGCDVGAADGGPGVEVDICGSRIPAEIMEPSPYDPEFSRLRG